MRSSLLTTCWLRSANSWASQVIDLRHEVVQAESRNTQFKRYFEEYKTPNYNRWTQLELARIERSPLQTRRSQPELARIKLSSNSAELSPN